MKSIIHINNLRTNALVNPLGIESTAPLLSYNSYASGKRQVQAYYQIIVASSLDQLNQSIGDMWDTGKVKSRSTSHIMYSGKPLRSRQRVYWKVRVWNEDDTASAWSEPAYWEAGLLKRSDWVGSWIGQGEDVKDNATVPMFVKEFELAKGKKVSHARLYISGLGLFEASLNGCRISDHYYDPGESDCRQTVYYVTYDVSAEINAGNNALGVMLGHGMYGTYSEVSAMSSDRLRYRKINGIEQSTNWEGLYGKLKVIAQLEVIYDDATIETIATDESWKFTDSPITYSGWFGGEDYDATKEINDWNCAGTPRDQWQQAQLMNPPLGRLTARECPPIIIKESYHATSVQKLADNRYLVDMGRNGAGIPELKLTGMTEEMRGGRITLYPAEILNHDGRVDQSTVVELFEWGELYDTYIVKGVGEESWRPSFCYHGYRYLEVELSEELVDWQASIASFYNHLLWTDNEVAGTFHSSSEDINTIHTIIRRAIESNMFSTLTDCPHMEKLGWMEVGQLLFNSIAASYDIQAWMKKITKDMVDSQEESGEAVAIAPEYQRITFLFKDPNWGGALIFTPWEMYQNYGDTSVLQMAYANMQAYVNFLNRQATDHLLIGYAQMGEWGAFDTSTPVDFVATCAYYRIVNTMRKIANILGFEEDAEQYEMLAQAIKKAFHDTYYDASTGVYGSGSQASYACALFSECVDPMNIDRSVELLVRAIADAGYHLSTGEVGLKQMLCVLAQYDRNDVVYKMITNKHKPSYLYFVSQGATTLPEHWDMERSQNHCMMGHANEWLMRSLAGISPTSPGYDSLAIKPYIPEDLEEVTATYRCNYGLITSHWKQHVDQGYLTMEVTIPIGPDATVYVPWRVGQSVYWDGERVDARLDEQQQYMVISNVGSGTHIFTVV